MKQEIERKYLLKNDDWKTQVTNSFAIKQGYLNSDKHRTVRVRVKGDKGYLTIKGKNVGATRPEYEYAIPLQDAIDMLLLCEPPIIEKTRHIVIIESHTWEIDIFEGTNAGLQVAEIELNSEDEHFTIPTWVGYEVTDDARYYNSSLISQPFSSW